jgi:ribosome maturation factor RimP
VERKLNHPRDFERFSGHKVKVVLRAAVDGQKVWAGMLKGYDAGIVTLEPVPGKSVQFPLDQVEKANLKFEW